EFLYLDETRTASIASLSKLKSLKLLNLRGTPVSDKGLGDLGAFSNLEFLYLSDTEILGPGLTGLKSAKSLRWLKLNGTRVDDASLTPLLDLPNLSRLEVSSTRITDATLARLAGAKKLTYLDIYGTNVTGAGIRRLGALNELRELWAGGTAADDAAIAALPAEKMFHLDVHGTRITDASVEAIGKMKNLNSLNLSDTAVTGATFSKLSGIEELRTLKLAGTSVTSEALDTITGPLVRETDPPNGPGGGFAWLNHLVLTDTRVTDSGLRNLSRLKRLFSLRLEGTQVTDRGLAPIARLPHLQNLHLDRTAVTDDGIAALTNSHRLRTLSLTRTGITDRALSGVGDAMRRLAFSHTRVSDHGVETLARRTGLQEIELAGTAITDRALDTIAGLSSLQVVDLSATAVSDVGVEKLKPLNQLRELRLNRTAVTDVSAEALANSTSLREVSLEGSGVTANGKALLTRRHPRLSVELRRPWADEADDDGDAWTHLALREDLSLADLGPPSAVRSLSLAGSSVDAKTLAALQRLKKLESLNLSDTVLDDGLVQYLTTLTRLRTLHLSRTSISDAGLKHLATLHSLEHLHLDGTQISGVGLSHLRSLTRLRTLHLGDTKLERDHIEHLAAMSSLRKISLTNTRVGDAELQELTRLNSLQYLDLYGTDVTDAGLASLEHLSSLSHLYLNATAVTDSGLASLRGLKELTELGLGGCDITDRGVERLTHFQHLGRLKLDRTSVTDVGAKMLSEMATLREVDLNGTDLGDRGLEYLASLPSLERLNVRDTDLSPSGVAAFQALRPNVVLSFGDSPPKFSWLGLALSLLYGLIALAICIYGAHRYLLVWLFSKDRSVRTAPVPSSSFDILPRVTIQIPLFNERNVAERIIAAACGMDYPRDRLQIQVLDDSTDDCAEIASRCSRRFRSEGINITCHHRETRAGFKSGALAAGLESATGEFIAIFDADFVPDPDFLKRTVHHFTDESVGAVQAEWKHLNRNESLLTQCQAMFLDGHFIVEQATRAHTGRWFNFNGTAGVWRRSCIDRSGGWSHETLTEDTDLSYRAQLNGWRFVYLPDVHANAELPSTMSAFLGQQHRWTRGLLQCAGKLLPRILRSHAPLRVKAEAWFHLTSPILYAVMFLLTALAIPATFVALPLSDLRGVPAWTLGTLVLLGGTLSAAAFVVTSQRVAGQPFWRTLSRLPALMALGIGMSAVNSRAAFGALLGVKSPFVRTPKFGGRSDSDADPGSKRGSVSVAPGILELAISGILLGCLSIGLRHDFALIGAPFLLLFAFGFLWVGGTRFAESERRETVTTIARSPALRWSSTLAVVT
ncbi:MAG: glycosyltransferase, partial [Planctomycetota bacterium]